MWIKKCDFLSPSITLSYNNESTHPSIFSGLLSIFAYGFSLVFGLYLTSDFFTHKNPNAYYFHRYIEDAGEFPINSSVIFSYIQLVDVSTNKQVSIQYDQLRIIGLEETIQAYHRVNDLKKYNHWIYGSCNINEDTYGIKNLINDEDSKNFADSACIKKYYDKNDEKYYNISSEKFRWPSLKHGCSNPNRTFYGITVEKCKNDSLNQLEGKICKSQEEISKFIKSRSVQIKIIDQYVDVLNYKKPLTKYFYTLNNGFFEDTYTVNNLNFNPALLISHSGIFVQNDSKEKSYIFEQNEKIESQTENTGIYVSFYFWMQNRMQYYDRSYKTFLDLLSDMGGFESIVITFAEFINILISNYSILFDTQELVFDCLKIVKEENNIKKYPVTNLEPTIYKNLEQDLDSVFNPPIKKHIKILNFENKTSKRLSQRNMETIQQKNFARGIRKEKTNHRMSSGRFSLISPKKSPFKKQQNKFTVNSVSSRGLPAVFIKNIKIKKVNDDSAVRDILGNDNLSKEKEKGKEKEKEKEKIISLSRNEKKIENNNITCMIKYKKFYFHEYLYNFICCGKVKKNISYFEEFRSKIISEEMITQNHFNIYKLKKLTEYIMKKNEDLNNIYPLQSC